MTRTSGDADSRPSQIYLWRVMGRDGLQKGEMPLCFAIREGVGQDGKYALATP